jgi:hypothetical protein
MTSNRSRICALMLEIQDAFLNTPDLALSTSDAVRRFGTDRITCEAILEALVDARVLTQMTDGLYESAFPELHTHRCMATRVRLTTAASPAR